MSLDFSQFNTSQRCVLFLGGDAAYMFAFRGPLIKAFLQSGHRVVVVATALETFDLESLADMDVEFHHWPLAKAGMDPLADLRSMFALSRILHEVRPDIFFAHTIKPVIYGLLLAALHRIPRRTAMIPGLGYAFAEKTRGTRRLISILARVGYRVALSNAHIVLFQNPDDREVLRQAGALSRRTPTAVVNGSGVDMTLFPAVPFPEGPVTFLLVARLLAEKGVREFVQAACLVRKSLPDARFVLVGAADQNPASISQEEVNDWAREGIIEIRGHLTDTQPEYARSHIFVLPSYYREGCPRVNLEAMSSGRPIITTDWVGCRETVIHGINGLLVPPRDPIALADAMIELGSDPERIKSMGDAGRTLCIQRFELSKVVEDTLDHLAGRQIYI